MVRPAAGFEKHRREEQRVKLLVSLVAGVCIMRKHGILEMLVAAVVVYLILGGIVWGV